MALDKNDGIFLPSIDGVVSGKTSQVDGMNGIMNNLIGNDNYLKDKKLDRGNYVGSGELLRKDDNGIWGGEYGGKIQDPIPKELNKRYIDNINGKSFICIKAGDSSVTSNTIEYFTPCNVVDNLGKLQNMFNVNGAEIFTLDNLEPNTDTIIYTAKEKGLHLFALNVLTDTATSGGSWCTLKITQTQTVVAQGLGHFQGTGSKYTSITFFAFLEKGHTIQLFNRETVKKFGGLYQSVQVLNYI